MHPIPRLPFPYPSSPYPLLTPTSIRVIFLLTSPLLMLEWYRLNPQRSRPDDKSPWGSPEKAVGAVSSSQNRPNTPFLLPIFPQFYPLDIENQRNLRQIIGPAWSGLIRPSSPAPAASAFVFTRAQGTGAPATASIRLFRQSL